MKKISVIGSGSWGTALAILLSKNGHNTVLWARSKEKAEKISESRENKEYLPGITLPDNIKVTYKDSDVLKSDMIILAVPSKAVRKTAERFISYFSKNQIIVNVAKGIEENSLLRLSQVIKEVVPFCRVGVLSGPSHAEEIGKGMAAAVVAASENIKDAEEIQKTFMSPFFRVYTNTDIIGVEIGGALKNLIALAAGISDGLGFGDNSKAALMTRGVAEISRLGVAMGGNEETFSGLSGIGDLIVTCTSKHSRNRMAGIMLGKGMTLDETLKEVHMVVEGVNTAKAAYDLSVKYNVNMPITKEIYNVLFFGQDAKKAVVNLMTRDKTTEYNNRPVR